MLLGAQTSSLTDTQAKEAHEGSADPVVQLVICDQFKTQELALGSHCDHKNPYFSENTGRKVFFFNLI